MCLMYIIGYLHYYIDINPTGLNFLTGMIAPEVQNLSDPGNLQLPELFYLNFWREFHRNV